MIILKSAIFNRFPEIIFGISTKRWNGETEPYYFNLSLSIGDDENKVMKNREVFFASLGLNYNQIAFQKQTHSDIVAYVNKPGFSGESDAIITDKKNIGLAVSVADCTPIFIYEKENQFIAGVHSGWRGSQKQILKIAIEKLINEYNCKPENFFVYIGPSISQKNYEVGKEVAQQFDSKYLLMKGDKFFLDVKKVNYDILKMFDIPEKQIQISNLCTYDMKDFLHSYRGDKEISGRAYGVIALKGNK